jgi:ATP-dependent Clp protease ATP-binding subunit ClpB
LFRIGFACIFYYQKISGSTDIIRVKVNSLIEKLPKVSEGNHFNIYLSNSLQQVFDGAFKEAGRLKDDFVSIEHILLALSEDNGPAGKLLREQGITKENILSSLKDIRGAQRVTSQAPEETYQSLKKYGRDLNQLAREGKLDPVIGRKMK